MDGRVEQTLAPMGSYHLHCETTANHAVPHQKHHQTDVLDPASQAENEHVHHRLPRKAKPLYTKDLYAQLA